MCCFILLFTDQVAAPWMIFLFSSVSSISSGQSKTVQSRSTKRRSPVAKYAAHNASRSARRVDFRVQQIWGCRSSKLSKPLRITLNLRLILVQQLLRLLSVGGPQCVVNQFAVTFGKLLGKIQPIRNNRGVVPKDLSDEGDELRFPIVPIEQTKKLRRTSTSLESDLAVGSCNRTS